MTNWKGVCDFTDVKKTFLLCRPLWLLPFELAEEKQQCSDPRSPRVANLRDESDRPGNCSAAGNNAEADLPPTCLPCRLPPTLSWSSPAPWYGGAVLTTPRTAGWLHQVWNFHLSLRASLLNPDLWIFTHFTLSYVTKAITESFVASPQTFSYSSLSTFHVTKDSWVFWFWPNRTRTQLAG